ncbi:MAG: hypothetical protein ACNS63_02530, partial [Candidatus Nitrospinota bacterium M3_3B_026]
MALSYCFCAVYAISPSARFFLKIPLSWDSFSLAEGVFIYQGRFLQPRDRRRGAKKERGIGRKNHDTQTFTFRSADWRHP